MASSLHNHSDMSFQDGYSKPIEYLKRASELKLKAIALTEHGNFTSAPYVDMYRKEYPDVKVIFGVEAYECFDIKEKDPDNKYFHLILLCKNENGRKAINKIITKSEFEGFYYKPRVDIEMLKPFANDLVVSTACLASKIAREADYDKCISYVNEYKSIFPHFYLEMQSHSSEDQVKYNKKILQLSKDTDTKFIITTDSHVVNKSDLYYQARHVQVARDSDTMSESYEGCYMQSNDEIHEILDSQIGYEYVEIGINNTDEIADMIDDVHIPFQEPKLPTFPLPDGFNDNKEYIRHLALNGWETRNIDSMSVEEINIRKERLEYELGIIGQMNYDGYFLIVWDFITWAKNNGVTVGDGRGSAGGSIVCYLLGISALDPIKYNLIFERFLNPERISMPDIDVDFADRDRVVKYLIDKYGENRVCQIMNFSEITPIVAIKDVSRILKIPYAVADKISKKFVYSTFDECMENNKELVDKYSEYQELFDIAGHLSGKFRFSGMHAGGVGIVDTDISDYMPMKLGSNGEHVIQVDKKMAEKIGIVKFDILGVSTLSVIQEVKDDLNIDEWEIDPNNDEFLSNKKMYEIFCNAKTNGVFQVESGGMKELLLKMQPNNINDVSAVLALYRPDSMSMLEDYIYYKHNPNEVKYLHDDMKQILEKTYGCIIFQESIMDITRVFGGRTYGGADKFRKGLGSKDKKLIISETEKLREEILNNGYTKDISDKICNQMETYGGYCFNKSHSDLYAVISLRTAYFKANYPLHFFKALFNDNKDKAGMINKYIIDAKTFNIDVVAPNINHSQINFSVRDGKILFGLSAISGIGNTLANAIIEERETNGIYKNFDDFILRISPTKSQVVALVKSGAFPTKDKYAFLVKYLKSLYEIREFKQVQTLPTHKKLLSEWGIDVEDYKKDKKIDKDMVLELYNNKKKNVFNTTEQLRYTTYVDECGEKYLQNKEFWEFEALQIFLNNNPFEKAYENMSKQFEDVENGEMCTIVGIIAKVQKKKDKNKKQFAYANIYSSFGLVEAIIWHTQLKEYEDLIVKGKQIAMFCRKDSDEKVVANKIKPYQQWLVDIRGQKEVS